MAEGNVITIGGRNIFRDGNILIQRSFTLDDIEKTTIIKTDNTANNIKIYPFPTYTFSTGLPYYELSVQNESITFITSGQVHYEVE